MWLIQVVLALLVLGTQDGGTIRVRTDVAGVKVILGDAEAGETPVTLGPMAPGKYVITLRKEGFLDHTEEVQVQAGVASRVFAVMKRIEVPLPAFPLQYRVFHQHRAGICTGVLTISAEEMHYKAENDTDEFHMPISKMSSVARSFGSTPGLYYGVNFRIPANQQPMRVELPGRSYGFFVIAGDQSKAKPGDAVLTEEGAQKTTELFQIVYTLWSHQIKSDKKK